MSYVDDLREQHWMARYGWKWAVIAALVLAGLIMIHQAMHDGSCADSEGCTIQTE